MLNKLRCHALFKFSASQITWSRLLIQIHILHDNQCRFRSVSFFRNQLIWNYTVCKGNLYPGSAGLGFNIILSIKHSLQQQIHCITGNIFRDKCCCCNLGSLYFTYFTFDLGKDLVLVKTVQTPLPCSASAPLPSRRFYYWSFFLYLATYWCRGIMVLLSMCPTVHQMFIHMC